MWLFTREPKAIVLPLLVAHISGVFLATMLLFTGERIGLGTYTYHVPIGRDPEPFGKSLWAHLLFGSFAVLLGLFFVLLYAIPVMAILRRFRLAGPLMALLISVLPGVLIGASGALVGVAAVGLLPAGFGLSVAVVFCAIAYHWHVLEQGLASDRSQAPLCGVARGTRTPALNGERRSLVVSKGQRYKVKKDVPVTAMTSWAAPFTGGYDRVLRAGEVFTISHDPPEGATAVYCDPRDYRRLHRESIPFRDRVQFWRYRGFYLCIRLKDIDESCERLDD